MATSSPVLLILGAGSNVGASVAKAFSEKGYKIALASRTVKNEDSDTKDFHVACDLSDPFSVPDVFKKVKETLGIPSVVVYNGMDIPNAGCPDLTMFKLLLLPVPVLGTLLLPP